MTLPCDLHLINLRSVTQDIIDGEVVEVDKMKVWYTIFANDFRQMSRHEDYRSYVSLLPIMGPYNQVSRIVTPKGRLFSGFDGLSVTRTEQETPENVALREKMNKLFGTDLNFESTMPGGGRQLLTYEAPEAIAYDLGNICPGVKFLDLKGEFVTKHTAKDIKDAMRLYNLHVHFQYPGWRGANLQPFISKIFRFPARRF